MATGSRPVLRRFTVSDTSDPPMWPDPSEGDQTMRRSRRIASAVTVVAAAALALTACGGGSSGSASGPSSSGASGGGSGSGSGGGGRLDGCLGAQPTYPPQFAQWSKDVTAKFKAATGADLTIETYSSSADE